MRGRWSLPAAALWAALSSTDTFAQTLTLEDALRQAESHPDVRIAEAEVRAAEGELLGARTLQYNPELGLEGGRQTPVTEDGAEAGPSGAAYGASVGQTFEFGGKRSRRKDAAEARLEAARARLTRARQTALAQVRGAYYHATLARSRVRATTEGETVATELRRFASERLELGAGTQLEFNVAAAAAGRARAERLGAERRYRQSRVELAAAIGAPPGEELETPADSMPGPLPLPDPEEFVRRALAARADVVVARAERRAAEAEVALARALALPDPTIAASIDREPSDRTILLGVSVPLPFFNRNQGGRAVAEALRTRATVVEEAAVRAVEREARAAHAAYTSAAEAAVAFDREVVDRLSENLELARESFRAGKISLLDFNVIRRDLVETRLAYLDALAELVEARRALETAGAIDLVEQQR